MTFPDDEMNARRSDVNRFPASFRFNIGEEFFLLGSNDGSMNIQLERAFPAPWTSGGCAGRSLHFVKEPVP
jgi:hypothetical protein